MKFSRAVASSTSWFVLFFGGFGPNIFISWGSWIVEIFSLKYCRSSFKSSNLICFQIVRIWPEQSASKSNKLPTGSSAMLITTSICFCFIFTLTGFGFGFFFHTVMVHLNMTDRRPRPITFQVLAPPFQSQRIWGIFHLACQVRPKFLFIITFLPGLTVSSDSDKKKRHLLWLWWRTLI